MKRTRLPALLALVLAAAVAAGCSAPVGADKAGGPAQGPLVLRLANGSANVNQAPAVADFVSRVRSLSGGSIQIKAINQWGNYAPSADAQLVHAVAAGTVDLGWTGSAVFDTVGAPGLRALSAPMLIDSYPLESAVLKSTLSGRMLAGLSQVHVTGLAVLGDGLRQPIAVRLPLLAPADWRGLSIGTYRSGVQEQAITALGATPVEAIGAYRSHYLATGTIQGFELDMHRYVEDVTVANAPYVTENVVLWPMFDVLFANPARLASLTAQQRAWIQQAAEESAASSVSLVAGQTDSYIEQACAMGARFATATPADLTALRVSFAPVYSKLETDPQTRAFISQIEQLKKTTPPGPASTIPPGCST